MNMVLENILFQASCGTLLGAKECLAMVPESMNNEITEEFRLREIKYRFESIDNSNLYKEPHFVYFITLPENFSIGA